MKTRAWKILATTMLLSLALFGLTPSAGAQFNYAISGNTAYVTSSPNATGNIIIAATYLGYYVPDPIWRAYWYIRMHTWDRAYWYIRYHPYLVLTVIFCILWLIRISQVIGTFSTTSDDPPRFTGSWKNVKIHSFTGYVRGREKQSITTVSGSVSGGSGHVSSSTTVTNSFRLVNLTNRKEVNFQLANFAIKIWEDQLVSVAWAIRKGQERGPYFIVVNHTTGEKFIKESVVKEIAKRDSRFWQLSYFICIFIPPVWLLGVFWLIFVQMRVSGFMSLGVRPLVMALNQKAEIISQDDKFRQTPQKGIL